MKIKYNNIVYGLISLGIIGLASCKDEFLQEKNDYTGVNEQVFEVPEMATAYVDYIYGLMSAVEGPSLFWELAVDGDKFTHDTEELSGQNEFNQPWAQISFNQNHALEYFGVRMPTGINNNTWTRIRQINIFLAEIDKHGMDLETRNKLKGQMFFWRAWQYFDLVKLYGGVPLVLTPQEPTTENIEENSIPRSSTSACIDQISADLDSAIALLPGRWDATNWGRITSGAASALKGRVLLTWASPLFNREDDVARWQRAYDANKAAIELLEANGFGLFREGNLENGEAWANMWLKEGGNPEAVMVFGFNSIQTDQTRKNNSWEQSVRSSEIFGSGDVSPTKQMVDAFPMKDGKMPGESSYTYDARKFYKNRDPRFNKTFVYNGAPWPYQENPDFIQWTYKWYGSGSSTEGNPNETTESQGANASGIYLCKATDPNASNVQGDFSLSGTDVMKIRFAEVVLNLAECAIGTGNFAEGIDGIKAIRERAGIENLDGNFGVTASSRDGLFATILNERRVEFAYEGMRFWDLRRWMLFDANSATANRLGLQDQTLAGKRRTGFFFIVKDEAGNRYQGDADPMLADGDEDAPLIDRNPETYPPGIDNYEEYLDYLYDNYFEIVEKDDLDPTNPSDWTYNWYPEYYFFGLHQNILTTSPYLEQTQGWNGLNGAGTFNPLL